MSITGEPGGAPAKNGNPVSDINAGNLAVVGILAAYIHKLKTGRGQVVDTSLMEAAVQQTYWHAAIYFATGEHAGPDRLGAHPDSAVPGIPRKRRLDQHRRRQPGELGAHRRSARASGVARRCAFPRPTPTAWRISTHSPTLMNAVLGTRTRAEWIEAFDAAGVPVGPVHSHRRSAQSSADARARHGRRSGAPTGGAHEGDRLSGPLFRDADRRRREQHRCSASTRAPYWVSTVTTMPRSTVSSPTVSRPDGHAYRRQAGIEMSRSVSSTFFSSATARSPSATMPTRLRALSTTGIRRIWCSPIRARTT